MKKILQINSVANQGSTGKIVEKIGSLVIDKGWESSIAYGRTHSTSRSNLIKIGNQSDQLIHGVKTRILDAHGFGSYRATQKLVNKIREIQPDIIHLHNLHGYYLNIEVLFEYLSSIEIPKVWTLHDCWPFTGHCTHFTAADCERWKQGCYDCPIKTNYPASWFVDNSKKNYEKKAKIFNAASNLILVTVSNWLKQKVELSFLKDYPVETIYNGIDKDIFKPYSIQNFKEEKGLKEQFIILGVADDWSRSIKGLNDFYQLSDIIDNGCTIMLVGLNKSQIDQLPENIIGVTRTENIEELVAYYNLADALVNPAKEESFGLVTAEALACGTPSIVYNTTACPEIVGDESGYVVPTGNVDLIWDKIKKIKKKSKDSYAKACRQRALSLFDEKKNLDSYLQLYNNLLN